jgi:hypothetical protein
LRFGTPALAKGFVWRADCVSDDGLAAVGLPVSYPRGAGIPRRDRQPMGAAAPADGRDGITCRSVARGGMPDDEELALFERCRPRRLVTMTARTPFNDWYPGTP